MCNVFWLATWEYSGEARYGLKFTSLTAWCRVISITGYDVITDDVIIDFTYVINDDVMNNDDRFHEFYNINYIWINYELLGTMENISADQHQMIHTSVQSQQNPARDRFRFEGGGDNDSLEWVIIVVAVPGKGTTAAFHW